MAVAAHHTGLKDSGCGVNKSDDTYSARINNYDGQEALYQEEIELPIIKQHKIISGEKQYRSFAFATYIKMLFSSLVDADWTDTEEYVTNIKRKTTPYTMIELEDKLTKKMPLNDGRIINNIRAEILSSCIDAATFEQGLYTLTVPTGGGKTLSSLAFSLKHAVKHNLKRIIYVIPYTSIIEQNADVISNCLGKEFVLEHHSNADYNSKDKNIIKTDEEESEDKCEINRLKWASENWDIPVILTTNVQFFESFFSNKPNKTRKLHNIAESVVIFDEAQMLPREFLSPSMYAISELVKNYKVTAILCSATQPAISKYKYNNINITEIIKNPIELSKKLKRVEYEIIGQKSDQEIVEILRKHTQILCVVNSRKHAYSLFQLLKENCKGNTYHISTLMCPFDRRNIIKNIKENLNREEKIVVISTSLIEAGVDIDFPVVMKSIAGIDSIIQAGGRANREGKLKTGKVIVFEPISDEGKPPKAIQNIISITKEVIELFKSDAFGIEGVSKYFELLYNASASNNILDSKTILNEFEVAGNSVKLNFETVANKFKLIEDNTKNIVVNLNEEVDNLIKQIRQGMFNVDIVRQLQQYSVSIYDSEFIRMKKDNALEILDNGYILLNNPQYYNAETGIDVFSNNNKNAECSII